MEIVFNNVSYVDGNKNSCLSNFNYTISNNTITGIISNNSTHIGELINSSKRPISGNIVVDNVEIGHSNHIESINIFRKKIAYVNCSVNKKFLTNTVEEEIRVCLNNYLGNCKNKEKRISDSLKMVGLNDSYIKRNPNELSLTEQKKVIFACLIVYNPELIIFENYELGMNYKEKENFKKLLRLLKVKYNKTIIIISNDVKIMFDLVDNYIVINNGELKLTGTKKDFYNNKLYKYIDMPKIVDFVKYARKSGHDIEEYTDIKELIKGIYRDVK